MEPKIETTKLNIEFKNVCSDCNHELQKFEKLKNAIESTKLKNKEIVLVLRPYSSTAKNPENPFPLHLVAVKVVEVYEGTRILKDVK